MKPDEVEIYTLENGDKEVLLNGERMGILYKNRVEVTGSDHGYIMSIGVCDMLGLKIKTGYIEDHKQMEIIDSLIGPDSELANQIVFDAYENYLKCKQPSGKPIRTVR